MFGGLPRNNYPPPMPPVNRWIGPSRSNGSRQYRSCSDVRTLAPDRKRFSHYTPGRVSSAHCIEPVLLETTPYIRRCDRNHKPLPPPPDHVIRPPQRPRYYFVCHVSHVIRLCQLPRHPPRHLSYPATQKIYVMMTSSQKSTKKPEKAQILLKVTKVMFFVYFYFVVLRRLCIHIMSNSLPTLQSAT